MPAAQDVEPEYRVSADSKTAWISLQRITHQACLTLNLGINDIFLALYKDTIAPNHSLKPHLAGLAEMGMAWMRVTVTMPSTFKTGRSRGCITDAIASYKVNDKTFLITANEG